MKNINLTAILFVFVFTLAAHGQTPTPTPSAEDDVVKITTKLVQLDALVTDKDGKPVTNLTASDFEILQDGKPQKIVSFSYVSTESPTNTPTRETKKADKTAITPTPVMNVRPASSGGRIITFIVDDGNCTASQVGMVASREALEKFVNEQMQPNDLVSIYQTRGGSSLLQQYTSDKTQLLRVARKIRWYPPTGTCASSDGSFFDAARSNTFNKATPEGPKSVTIESGDDRRTREASEDFSRNNQVEGTIGVLRYVVRGLERVNGRKVVFLLSDGMPFRSRDGKFLSAVDVLRDLTDLANRSSVVFNTIDVRGLFNTSMIEARDEVSTIDASNVNASDKVVATRSAEVRNTQDGLFFLANETGGNFYQNQNFLDVPVRRALSLEKGYYLIAYQPDDETFKGKNFNKIEIKLKRPDLKVSSRAGFLGKTDEATKPKKRTDESELYEAIVAPLPRAGLNLQLTAFFVNTPTEGNLVRSLTHLEGNEITFVDEPNGFKKAVFDVVAVTLNEKNEVVDEFTRTHIFKIEAAAIPLIKQNGLIYTTDVPVKKAGTYNFRVAVRDAASRTLGSASQIVQVPDLKKNKLFLSGLTVAQLDQSGKFSVPSAVKPENAISLTASTAVPAIRHFRRGAVLAYAYTIYNSQLDQTTNQPKLSIQMNLYHDGKLMLEGKPQPADLEKQADWSRVNDYAYLRLNPNVQSGDYVLQIIVKDLLANQTTAQSVDFEIID
ncbi:MAG: VWA domain-containing protein [Pyrinomonadaceae bacterium]